VQLPSSLPSRHSPLGRSMRYSIALLSTSIPRQMMALSVPHPTLLMR
jgi:hypothetical protein